MSEERSWQGKMEMMQQRLAEDRAFLQSYMLDPNPDNRPAEEERIKDILALADEMEHQISELMEKKQAEELAEPIDQDFNLEYKTHILGQPDDNDTIEGDWTLGEEEPVMPLEEETKPKKKSKKKSKNKKDKKAKKHKK